MAFYGKDISDISLAKETTRGTAETSPTKYLKVSRDSALQYDLVHVPNELIQGQKLGEWAPEAGRKAVTGNISGDLEAQTCGELLYSLLGKYSGTQMSTSTAYQHTFSVATNGTNSNPSYTIFTDRGYAHYRYNGCVVKKMTFSGSKDGRANFAAEILGRSEATATTYTPTIAASDPMMFHQASVEIATVANTSVGNWSFSIDNQAEALYLLDASQDASDIVIVKKPIIEGSFDLLFEDTAQRDIFLASTSQKLEFILTGDTITGTNKYLFHPTFYGVKWIAMPWDGEGDAGLQQFSAAFKGFYSVSDTKAVDILVQNQTTTY